MDRYILSAGRISYAVLAGLSLLIVSLDASLTNTVGAYTLQSGLAAAAATVLPLGLDRAIARRKAAGEFSSDLPSTLLRARLLEIVCILLAVGIVAASTAWGSVAAACGAFAVFRLVYADLEAFWIASGRSIKTLGSVVASNGLITAAGILVAAPLGASIMVLASSAGNAVAFLALLLLGRWVRSKAPLPGLAREASGFGFSSILAVAYSRADLLILAVLDVDLAAVAVYGIVTRAFDAAGLIRGSIAQIESRTLARMSQEERVAKTLGLSKRTFAVSLATGVVGLAILFVILPLPAFDAWGDDRKILYIAALSVPAYMAHLATTALVFADRRSHILLVGSAIAAATAVALKFALISAEGVAGAVVAIGVCEVVSFGIFIWAYRGQVAARQLLPVGVMALASVCAPIVGLVVI